MCQTNLRAPGEDSRVGKNGVRKALPVLENFWGAVSAEPTVLPWASEDAVNPKIYFPSATKVLTIFFLTQFRTTCRK